MKGASLLFLGVLLAGSPWLFGAEPEYVVLKEHDANLVRRYITKQFAEVLSSPVVVDNQDYMEVKLIPNGFVTFIELILEIKLKETLKGLELRTNVVKEDSGKRIPIYEEDTQKVLYLLLEQVQYELHNAMQAKAPLKPAPDGFLLFDDEMGRLDKKLGNGPFDIAVSAYPQKGRIYKKTNDKTKSLELMLIENPAKPGTAKNLQIVWAANNPMDANELKKAESELDDWLRVASGLYIKKSKLKFPDLFRADQPVADSSPPFKISYQAEGKAPAFKKTLNIEEGK